MRRARKTIPAAISKKSEATLQANGYPMCETRRPNNAGPDAPPTKGSGLHCTRRCAGASLPTRSVGKNAVTSPKPR